MSNETPNACPHCGAEVADWFFPAKWNDPESKPLWFYKCKSSYVSGSGDTPYRTDLCREREARQKAEAELAELWSRFDKQMEAEDKLEQLDRLLIDTLDQHQQFAKWAKIEVDTLRGKLTRAVSIAGVLLADIEDFHEGDLDDEWTRRDYPTEQEVKEIMNRYYDLLNK